MPYYYKLLGLQKPVTSILLTIKYQLKRQLQLMNAADEIGAKEELPKLKVLHFLVTMLIENNHNLAILALINSYY